MAAAPHQRVPEVRLDQPRAAGRLGLPAEHRGDPAADEPAHVPAHLAGLEGAMRLLEQMTRGAALLRRAAGCVAARGAARRLREPAVLRRQGRRRRPRRAPSRRSRCTSSRSTRPAPLRKLLLDLPRPRRASRTRRAAEAITGAELDRLAAAAPAQARAPARDRGLLQRRGDGRAQRPAPAACRACADGRARAARARRERRARRDRRRSRRRTRDARRRRGADRLDALRRDLAAAARASRSASRPGATPRTRRSAQLRADGYPARDVAATPRRASTRDDNTRRARRSWSTAARCFASARSASRASSATTTTRCGASRRSRPATPYSEKLLLDYQERLHQGRPVRRRVGRARPRPGQRRRRAGASCSVQAS